LWIVSIVTSGIAQAERLSLVVPIAAAICVVGENCSGTVYANNAASVDNIFVIIIIPVIKHPQ